MVYTELGPITLFYNSKITERLFYLENKLNRQMIGNRFGFFVRFETPVEMNHTTFNQNEFGFVVDKVIKFRGKTITIQTFTAKGSFLILEDGGITH
jgi:hypothetical protein